MLKETDEIDRKLLDRIKEHPGEHVRAIIKPLFLEKSESALRSRIALLELRGLVRFERSKSEVRCYLEKNPEAEG